MANNRFFNMTRVKCETFLKLYSEIVNKQNHLAPRQCTSCILRALYDIDHHYTKMINIYLCLQLPKRNILNDAINYRLKAVARQRCHLLIGT
jgi:hypothetical protein